MSAYNSMFISDGLSLKEAQKRFKKRREILMEKCKDGLVVISGEKNPINHNKPWLMAHSALYQDPVCLYYSGVNQLGAWLILDAKKNKEYLVLPKKDSKKTFWEGIHLGSGSSEAIGEAISVSGFKQILSPEEGWALILASDKVHLFWHKKYKNKQKIIKDCHYTFKKTCSRKFLKEKKKVTIKNCDDHVWAQRLIMDETDCSNIKEANKQTGVIFKELLKNMKTFKSEQEVSGFIKGKIATVTSYGESFPPIIASGKNAGILHYTKNNEPLDKKGMLLLDFGLRTYSMPSDVSRSVPINGMFSPLQKALYIIVIEAQKLVESQVKEGVSIHELNESCWSYIESKLTHLITENHGKMTRSYQRIPHNVSHLMGLMVHDGDSYRHYKETPLKEGMVISNEPGIYGYFEAVFNGKKISEHIGIRVEDNLLVCKEGSQNLSKSIPKKIEEIEHLMLFR